MLLKLVDHRDPVLHSPCQKWDFSAPSFDLAEFAENLVETMVHYGGIGLAANQVGVPYRILAMRTDPFLVAVNPRIVETSTPRAVLDEGCLSYPGLVVKVKRPGVVSTRFNHPDGSAKTYKFDGMTARVFLHEYDHLDGVTMLDATDRFHRERAERRLKKIDRAAKTMLTRESNGSRESV